MRGYSSSDDRDPLFWLHGQPIHATALLVLVFVASMLLTTLLSAFNLGAVLNVLIFSSTAVRHGAVWQLLTYAFVNPPSLGFVVNMLMLWWFGRDIEQFFGRRLFLKFYAAVILVPVLLLTLLGWNRALYAMGEPGSLAVFIAFATLYPNAALFFGILAKWFAAAIVGIYSLMYLAGHAWVPLLQLWMTVGLGYGFVRYEQGRLALPKLRLSQLLRFRRRPKFRVVPKPEPEPRRASAPPAAASETDVDALLDKIARSGLNSLTDDERARLEKARQDLLKKGH